MIYLTATNILKHGCAQKAYLVVCFSSLPNLSLFEYFDTLTDTILLYLGQVSENRRVLMVWKQQVSYIP